MISYSKSELDNTFLVAESKKLNQSGFIHFDQYKKLSKEIPTLKTQDNLLIRFCLFVLGCIAYASVCGVLALFWSGISNYDFDSGFKIIVFIYALMGFGAMEIFMVKGSKLFGYGLDDAALLGAQLALGSGVAMVSDGNYFLISLFVAIASVFSYLRYLNMPSLIVACGSCIASLAFFMFDFIEYGKSLLPFVLLAFTGFAYFIFRKTLNNLQQPYYAKGIVLAKSFCLILFYLAGNYFIVRELSFRLREDYYEDYTAESAEISFALFFWAFTFLVPVVYLVFGLLKKDKIMLWIGFLALVFSFYSFRMYHHVLPPEVALTLGGLILFAVAYFAIKKLKTKESGVTFLPDRFSTDNSLLNLEVLATASQFGMKPEISNPSPMEFGGGGFSGGGAGESF
jgi:hypothetical protein